MQLDVAELERHADAETQESPDGGDDSEDIMKRVQRAKYTN